VKEEKEVDRMENLKPPTENHPPWQRFSRWLLQVHSFCLQKVMTYLIRKKLLQKHAPSYTASVNKKPVTNFMSYDTRKPKHIWPNHACYH